MQTYRAFPLLQHHLCSQSSKYQKIRHSRESSSVSVQSSEILGYHFGQWIAQNNCCDVNLTVGVG